MDRRSFLVGLFGTAVVAAAGPIPQVLATEGTAEFTRRLKEAWCKVYADHVANVIIYGCGAIKYTNTFPYIECIHPSLLEIEEAGKNVTGLLP